MKKVLLTMSLICISGMIYSQESIPEKPNVKVSGYVKDEIFYDTYKSVDTRDGEIYSYPLRANYDANGKDLNKFGQFEMLGIQSRIKVSGSGTTAFGAKASGAIEAEFLGSSQDNRYQFILRHAFLKFDWSKTHLLMGQYWHPNTISEFIPNTVLCSSGITFSPFARTVQIRVTQDITPNMTLMGAIVEHSNHRSVEPAGNNSQRNAGIPDLQAQLQIGNVNNYFFAITAGVKFLKPYLSNKFNGSVYQATSIVSSGNFQVSAGCQTKSLSIKLQGNLGGNMTNFNMMGGYAPTDTSHNHEAGFQYEYANIKIYSVWTDLETKGQTLRFGLFAGFAQNIGTNKDVILNGPTLVNNVKSTSQADLTRDANLKTIYRISPRVYIISGAVDFGIEYILNGAIYGTFSGKKIINTDKATKNNRMMVSARYSF